MAVGRLRDDHVVLGHPQDVPEHGKDLKVSCQFFVESEKKQEGLHVNNYHERLKTWVNYRLRGVATKYLPHYLAWQRLKTWRKGPISTSAVIGSALGHQRINV